MAEHEGLRQFHEAVQQLHDYSGMMSRSGALDPPNRDEVVVTRELFGLVCNVISLSRWYLEAGRASVSAPPPRYLCGCAVGYHGGDSYTMVCPMHGKGRAEVSASPQPQKDESRSPDGDGPSSQRNSANATALGVAQGREHRGGIPKDAHEHRAAETAGSEPADSHSTGVSAPPGAPRSATDQDWQRCINCDDPHDARWFGDGNIGPFCNRCADLIPAAAPPRSPDEKGDTLSDTFCHTKKGQ